MTFDWHMLYPLHTVIFDNLKNEARRTTGKHMQKSGLLFVTASADPVTVIVCEA